MKRWLCSALLGATIAACPMAGDAASAAGKRGKSPAASANANPAVIISEADLKATMREHKGRPVVLHFWATWCLPCMDELPLIETLTKEAKSKGVELLSLSLDDPSPRAAKYVGKIVSERAGPTMTNKILKVEDTDGFIARVDPRWEGDIPAFFAFDGQGILKRAFVGIMKRKHFDEFVADLVGPAKK